MIRRAIIIAATLTIGAGIAVAARRGSEPMAVSSNPGRFTDPAQVEKPFDRDCSNVLGRACTAEEKGDFITYLKEQ